MNWDALAAMSGTIVLLMAVERIEQFAKVLLEAADLRIRRCWWSSTARLRRNGRCARRWPTRRNTSVPRVCDLPQSS